MDKLKELYNKIKSVKHIEIYLALILCVIVALCYFFFLSPESDKKEENSTENYTNAVEYADYLEHKLCNVLSDMTGVKSVSAIITLDGGFTYEYAVDSEQNTTNSGSSSTSVITDTTILVDGQPIIVKVNYPKIKGVVIVAEGSEDFSVKMNILEAVQTLLEISASDITVLY